MSNNKQTADFYRRKCRALMKEKEELLRGTGQLSAILDGTLVQICKKYGVPVYEDDPESRELTEGNGRAPVTEGKLVSTGREFEPIGWRIEIPEPALDGCRIKATKRDGKYIIGAVVTADFEKMQKSAEKTSGNVQDIPDRGQNMPEVKGS
ncbi:MAG: hypothetical protein IJL83_02210 [Clostridia bacterium]|nr:hypothetical protein [Clostridia bacterium]